MKPKFSIVLIAKNEANTLPRLFDSLEDFKQRGGEVCLLDTGSKDSTIEIARKWGAKIYTGQFSREIHEDVARKINQKYLVDKEPPIVEKGYNLFNFSAARNFINKMASNDMVCTLDADEAYTKFDIDKINEAIDQGYTQFEYQFVYAHDHFGKPTIQFIQSKFFDRRKAQWEGIVHEVVTGSTNLKYLDESVIKLEHYQEPNKPHRGGYLPGLALDCFENQNKDRQSHYFARELMYSGRWASAIKEFKRHLTFNGWPAERAQSMIHIAECYGHLGDGDQQLDFLHRAFDFDSTKRSALIQLAFFMKSKNNYQATAAYAAAALQIPWSDYYANNRADYEDIPHGLMYWAQGWMGNMEEAKKHILLALQHSPYNPDYLRDTKFYFEYPDNGLEGWMVFSEQQFLYETAQKYKNIVEIGSWMGKSTHALLTGALKADESATVTAVDTWAGSADTRDMTNYLAKQQDVYAQFYKNVGHYKNLRIIRKQSVEAAADFADGSVDFLFLDAGHTKEDLKADLTAWMPKMKPGGLISGHDYMPDVWMGVIEAVDEVFGKPDGVAGLSIWYVKLKDRPWIPPVTGENQIPKKIWTAWLSEDPMPDDIKKCIESQKIPGYDHHVIELQPKQFYEDPRTPEYLRDAIRAKKWVKAVDYLRMYTLYHHGGIFLDADVEILPGKNFDCELNEKLFVGKEVNNPDGSIVLGTAVIGAQAKHPLISRWRAEVEQNFRGDDDKFYESSMDLLNKLGVDYQDQMHILEPDVFYPYSHFTGQTNITERTIAIHHFNKSWTPEKKEKKLHPLSVFTKWIKEDVDFTFVKLGDGEQACMEGQTGYNCDGHNYSPVLAEALKDSFAAFKENEDVFIREFEDQKNYNILLHRADNDPSIFWKAIKKSTRQKIFVGPRRLIPAYILLLCDFFHEVPEVNAFDSYKKLIDTIPVTHNAIYIFCAGFVSKLMIADLTYKLRVKATYIDAGSAWDPLVSQTRTYQMSRDQVLALYQDKPVDNFKLDQETHPERLWVINKLKSECFTERIIDLGCGTNKTVNHSVGVDIRPVTDVCGSIESIPAIGSINTESHFDVIISRHSLEHVLDPVKTIREWMRILKPHSKMLIVLPDHGSIDTIDPYYSAGQHLHAYSMESFKSFISAFKDLFISKCEIVLQNWSFGTVIHYQLPTVSIIIPSLGRPEGLKRCKDSIAKLNYPQHKIEILEIEGEGTVPEKMRDGLEQATGDIICYGSNDIEFTPDSLLLAVEETKYHGLVAFNTGELLPDEGNICEHFVIRRDLVNTKLNGIIFDTRLNHCGVDNLLWSQAKRMEQAVRCEQAIVHHFHFSRGGVMDEIYERGWRHVAEDRKKLKEIMENI